jgi:hypothetical protein
VDVVELFGKDPFVFRIVDFEAAVGRDAEGMLITQHLRFEVQKSL